RRRRTVRALRDDFERRAVRSRGRAGYVFGDGAPLRQRERRTLTTHAERAERRFDMFGRQGLQRVTVRHSWHRAVMAAGAMLAVEGFAGRRGRWAKRGGGKSENDDCRDDDVAHEASLAARV